MAERDQFVSSGWAMTPCLALPRGFVSNCPQPCPILGSLWMLLQVSTLLEEVAGWVSASSRGQQDAGEAFRGPRELGTEAVQWLEWALRFLVLRVTVLESTGLTNTRFRPSLEKGAKVCREVRNLEAITSSLAWSLRHSGFQFAHLSLRGFMDGYIGLAQSLFEFNELFGPRSMRSCLYRGLWIWKICHFMNRSFVKKLLLIIWIILLMSHLGEACLCPYCNVMRS